MPKEATQENLQVRTTTRFQETVIKKERIANKVHLKFARGRRLLVSEFLGCRVGRGDEVQFAVPHEVSGSSGPELLIKRSSGGFLYQATLQSASIPKVDRHSRPYVPALILDGTLELSRVHLPCAAIRDYFYLADPRAGRDPTSTLYDCLKVNPTASLADLRLAYRLRKLELQAAKAPTTEQAALARSFNILAIPELRACHDALMKDPQSPALFPFGGYGGIVVAGTPLKDCFFARKILAYWPERTRRQIKLPLRRLDYLSDRAIYRNTRSRLEVTLDRVLLPIDFKPGWNQGKHLLVGEIQTEAEFVKMSHRLKPGTGRHPVPWEIALASQIRVTLPPGLNEAIRTARQEHHRLGRHSPTLDGIRERVQAAPVDRSDLLRMLAKQEVPADFDPSRLIWQPDYEAFYYQQLSHRATRVFLYRKEFIFLTKTAVVVETPKVGHATYLFARPGSIEAFLGHYAGTTKDSILRNQRNCAEYLGFQVRIVHGQDRQHWLHELRKRLGEPITPDEEPNPQEQSPPQT
jgi:hypothetical protein